MTKIETDWFNRHFTICVYRKERKDWLVSGYGSIDMDDIPELIEQLKTVLDEQMRKK